MAEETLKIVITADNKSAIDGLKQVSSATQTFVTAQGKMVVGAKQAGAAINDFSRIVQDAPFGLMGVTNNINPMLESFQRLKAETGSTSAALKNMAGSLMGAGGLGLAVSLVSSAFLIYQNGIMGFNRKTQEAKEAINQFTDSGVLKAVESVRALEREIQLAKQGIISKDGVVNHYNETIGKTTGLVNSVNEAEIKLKNNAGDYIKMQLAKAAANLALADAAKLELEIAELQAKKTQEFGKGGTFGAGQSSAPGFVPGQGDGGMASRMAANAAEKTRLENELKKKLADKQAIYDRFSKQNEELFKQHPEWNFFDDTKPQGKNTTGAPKMQLEDFHGKQKYAEAALVQQHLFDVQKQMYELSQKQYQQDLKNEALIRLGKPTQEKFQGRKNDSIGQAAAQQQEATQQTLLGIEQSRISALDEMNKKFKEQMALGEGIANTFVNMLDNIASAPDPFAAIGESLKRLAIDLAATVAKMLIIRAIMTAINPAAGAAKGIGGILGSIIGGVTPFATGGIVTGPTMGLVGEAGPEAILPLDRFQAMQDRAFGMGSMIGAASGGGGSQGGEFTLRGNDLVLALQRSNYSLNLRR